MSHGGWEAFFFWEQKINMPISSIVIKSREDKTDQVVTGLKALAAVTIEHIKNDHIVAVTETLDHDEDKDLWAQIENMPGVMQLDLIYHNFEDIEE